MRTWKYEAVVRRVVDGETLVCDVDLGMNHWVRNQDVRLAGISAEGLLRDLANLLHAGPDAREFLESLLQPDQRVWLVTTAYERGRAVALVYAEDPLPEGPGDQPASVNRQMIDAGQAVADSP